MGWVAWCDLDKHDGGRREVLFRPCGRGSTGPTWEYSSDFAGRRDSVCAHVQEPGRSFVIHAFGVFLVADLGVTQFTKEQLVPVLRLLVRHLASENYVCSAYAAIAIERVLFMKQGGKLV